jgi:AraC-like DNA-binding protein
VEIVAKDLRVSPRTLQRRLEESGTTYQQLLDEVRQETARKLLAATGLESGEIGFLLGFEELNSFTRAVHDREGATPMRWRAANVVPRRSSMARGRLRPFVHRRPSDR